MHTRSVPHINKLCNKVSNLSPATMSLSVLGFVCLFWFIILSRTEQVQEPGNLEKDRLVALYENHK